MLAAGYLVALRGVPAPRWRVACFLGGCALLVVALVTPLDTLARTTSLGCTCSRTSSSPSGRRCSSCSASRRARASGSPAVAPSALLTHPSSRCRSGSATTSSGTCPALYDTALGHPRPLLASSTRCTSSPGSPSGGASWQDAPHRLSSAARAAYVFAAFVLSARSGSCWRWSRAALRLLRRCARAHVGAHPLDGPAARRDDDGGRAVVVFFVVFAFWFFRFLSEQERRRGDVA